jgi:hypothetical protein
MTGTVEQQYIVNVRHPYPPDGEKIRGYVWYERFSLLNQELLDAGVTGGKERADIIVGVEKMMVAAAAASIFGHDVHRERAARYLAAELRAGDPDCPIPPQVKAPIAGRKGKAAPKKGPTQSALPSE